MIVSLLLKLGFFAWLLLVIIPRFARRRKIPALLSEAALSILGFIGLELLAPGIRTHQQNHDHNFFSSFWFHLIVYVLILSFCLAWFFTKEWIRNERLKRQLIETQLTTELNFLKSQINPHFLFNTLNNLYSIAQKSGSEQLETGIYKLSGLMRYVIYETAEAKVPLSKEIEYIHDFIGLSKLRFTEEEAQVAFSITGDVNNALIAPMILLPFVENAFKHGVKIESPSNIDISIHAGNGRISFDCTNAVYHLRNTIEGGSGVGLENVKRRLDLLYPGKHKLDITKTAEKYSVHLELT